MGKVKLTRRLFKVHSWLGLISGLFLLVLGLSGSILVFRHELDTWANRELLQVTPQGTRSSPLQQCYDTITRRYPNLDGIAWLNPDASPTEAYNFRLYFNDTRLFTYDLALISFDPYTGAILREGPSADFTPSFIEWLLQFHFSFQLGIPGAALTAVFGLTMLVSLLTGVVVYRKMIWRVLTFRVKINRKNWRTISSDLHRVVGVWSLLLNAVIFFTGFWMNLFAFQAKSWRSETIPTKPNTLLSVSPDRLLQQALLAFPGLDPTYVYLPTQPTRTFEVRGYTKNQWKGWGNGNSVKINQQTGEIIFIHRLSEKPLGERIEGTFFPLHVGNYGGWPVKILYVIVGLTPGLLSVTGFLLWWRNKRKTVKLPISGPITRQ
ncbi:PepSY-associated TM helix domain-containing protein [Siphonobacter curvatus]|uniref:PepSY domain-containing protein n=1 Tax=Siphonobacter curvatus TaxID=2094562 RepID=A0A2S7IJR1_9BACT|nr:PepSY-associated TM helix domain-containing protein [Siphonobacter curvatus]PQA56746.1 PepSY domain-containing protein [Siphonobacter curvatus]